MKRLFEALELKDITFEKFVRVSNVQLHATLKNLADGLPVFEVNADTEEPEIKTISPDQ